MIKTIGLIDFFIQSPPHHIPHDHLDSFTAGLTDEFGMRQECICQWILDKIIQKSVVKFGVYNTRTFTAQLMRGLRFPKSLP